MRGKLKHQPVPAWIYTSDQLWDCGVVPGPKNKATEWVTQNLPSRVVNGEIVVSAVAVHLWLLGVDPFLVTSRIEERIADEGAGKALATLRGLSVLPGGRTPNRKRASA